MEKERKKNEKIIFKKCKICQRNFGVEIWKSRNRLYCDNCRYKKCLICERSILIKLGEKEKTIFCSKTCYSKFQKGRKRPKHLVEKSAEGHRGNKTGKYIRCRNCNKEVYKYPKDLKNKRHFCCPECFRNYIVKNASPKRNNKEQEKKWKKEVYKRDNYICQACEGRGKKLNAHHIKSWASYPKLRYEINNGITLCRSCHQKIHTKEKNILLDVRISGKK